MLTNQSYFFHFGIDGATDWTMVDEDELSLNISVISNQELTMFFNLLFYNITFESNLSFHMQADDSVNPSILTFIELDAEIEGQMVINKSRDNTLLTLISTKDRIKCTSTSRRNYNSCGVRNMPAMNQNSVRLLLKKLMFQPRDPSASAFNNEWYRNKYTWSGTKYMVVGETRICPFIGKCYQCKYLIFYII